MLATAPARTAPSTTETSMAADNLIQETGNVRVRRCKHGLIAYIPHDPYIGYSMDLYGEFSGGEAKVFEKFVHKGMTALDVGANIGAHSVFLAQRVGAQGRLLAFEPQRVLFHLLCANLSMNGLLHAEPYNAAAGREAGKLFVPPVDYGRTGNYGSLALGQWKEGTEVPIMTIDSLDLPACHFIKADVEGMESEVMKGAAETLRKHRPVLYVENDRAEKSEHLIETIFGMDYRCYWHLTPYYSADNFYGNDNNIFKGIISINMLCIPKESTLTIVGLPEIKTPQDEWRKAGQSA